MKASFVKTIIPTDQYKEVQEIGDIVICHFDPKDITMTTGDGETTTMTECSEGSTTKDQYTAEAMLEAYNEWKAKQEARTLEQARASKLEEIEEYDQSDKVNGFSLNGMTVWLDKSTRVGLMNSTTIAKNLGNDTTTLWLGSVKIEVNCDTAISLLSALEMYALECFNVTAAHKKAVEALSTVEEITAYDITAGYPDQLSMTL